MRIMWKATTNRGSLQGVTNTSSSRRSTASLFIACIITTINVTFYFVGAFGSATSDALLAVSWFAIAMHVWWGADDGAVKCLGVPRDKAVEFALLIALAAGFASAALFQWLPPTNLCTSAGATDR